MILLDNGPLAIKDRIHYQSPNVVYRAPLTSREFQVLSLIAWGYSQKEVAVRVGISHQTVKNYTSRILIKTGAPNLLRAAVILAQAMMGGEQEEWLQTTSTRTSESTESGD